MLAIAIYVIILFIDMYEYSVTGYLQSLLYLAQQWVHQYTATCTERKLTSIDHYLLSIDLQAWNYGYRVDINCASAAWLQRIH